MGCCKCEKYKWPDPQEAIWKDGYGNEYCVFHAPKEHKKINSDIFNELVFTRIDIAISSTVKNTSCDFSGTVFPDDISFRKYANDHHLVDIFFMDATFSGKSDFRGTTFGGLAFFFWTKFCGEATFIDAKFCGRAIFLGATFEEVTRFSGATFDDEAIFTLTKFNGTSHFTETAFLSIVNFSMATFTGETLFKETRFGKWNSFLQASFEELVIFTSCPPGKPLIYRELQSAKDLRFFGMDMCATDFLHTPLANIRFQNVTWKKTPDGVRYSLPIEDDPEQAGMQKDDPLLDDVARYGAVADFYRQMKKRNRDEQNDAEASLWHYAEKEVQLELHRLEKPRSFQFFMLKTYRLISRYGEDPWQALKVLGVLMTLLGITTGLGALCLHGFSPSAINPERAGKLALTFAQYSLLVTPTYTLPPSFAAAALFISRLLIPIQAAIFAFALRNKLHR